MNISFLLFGLFMINEPFRVFQNIISKHAPLKMADTIFLNKKCYIGNLPGQSAGWI